MDGFTSHGGPTTASPDLPPQSDDDLFDTGLRPYETVETVPLKRADQDDDGGPEQDTLATLPFNTGYQGTERAGTARLTQPTQIIRRSPPAATSSSPSRPTIHVAASSPLPTPLPARKQSGVLASTLMAPAGTFLRRPLAPPRPQPPPITIDSDDEGPTYKGDSSDDERQDLRKSDIKTTNSQRRTAESDTVPESPARGNNLFKSIISNASYGGLSNGVKRSADAMATAYGNASFKRPRQTGPSRALPVSSKPEEPGNDMDVNDISDPNLRKKVRRMTSIMTQVTTRQCYEALMLKKGHYEDATEYLLEQSEKQAKQTNKHIDLTSSDDELMPTPAIQKKHAPVAVKQQVKVPQKSIAEKWSSTQQASKPPIKKLDVFDTPLPKKSRSLVRGRKNRSSPAPEEEQPKAHIGRQVVLSDDSDEDDSGIHSAPDDKGHGNFEDRLLEFFNKCTVADLIDTAVIKPVYAEHIVSKRPFKTIAAVAKIEAPDLKPTKGRRKTTSMGEKVADKVAEMLQSYEAVDYLVGKCLSLAHPLTAEIKSWGVKMNKSENGELDMISLHDSHRSCHDSGIGTPVSDDEIRNARPKNFLKQPAIMSSDYRLKDYQVVGMNWLNLLYQKRLSCILADDMGLGKTYQVIAFLAHLLETGDKGPHLIVVPAATIENWLQEFHRFCPALRVEPYYSTQPGERAEMRYILEGYRDNDNLNVVVTTYQLAKAKEDFPWLREFGFRCAVFDEGHVLKNANSQVSRKLNRIKSKFRLLLTGTPLQNNLRELISLLAFMMPNLFQEKQEELEAIFTHNVKALDENHEALLSAQRIARARSMLTPFILRRKKHQVLKELPKKDRRVEYCDLTPEQAEIYHFWLQKAFDIRERRERGEEIGNESTHILMKLRQAAIHPFLFRRLYKDKQLPQIAKQCLKDEQWRESNPNLIVTELLAYSDMELHKLCDDHTVLRQFALNNGEWLASGKVQKMLSILHAFIADGHRTLIFSQFTMVLDILELVLEREAIYYFRLDGSTKVSERQDLIDEFNSEENTTPVFMLSTKAGGAGINLAKANKVIVFDSGFNPQDDIQAENRAHRIGQVKDVEVVRLVTRGTVEEQIYKMGLTKLRLDEEVAGVGGGEVDNDNGEGSDEGKTRGKEGEKDDETETEKETEGRKMVEDLFFRKLEEAPEEVVAEAQSPVQKTRRLDAGEDKEAKEEDSQKTLKPEAEAANEALPKVNVESPATDANAQISGKDAGAQAKIKQEPSSQPQPNGYHDGALATQNQDDDLADLPSSRPKRAGAAAGERKSPKKLGRR